MNEEVTELTVEELNKVAGGFYDGGPLHVVFE